MMNSVLVSDPKVKRAGSIVPMKIFRRCLLALLAALLGAAINVHRTGQYLEEEFGLALLFKLRGPVAPPPDIAIVSIDPASAETLHLPDDPEKWPRLYYSQLITGLNQQNPALIALNLHFGESRDSEADKRLAEAMAQHRNTILSNYLKHYTLPALGRQPPIHYERIIDPVDIFEQAALGTSPFPLPKNASTVKEFWTYKNSAGDIPTFPATIFQYFVLARNYADILALLEQIDPSLRARLPDSFDELRENFRLPETLQQIKTSITGHADSLEELAHVMKKPIFAQPFLIRSWLAFLYAPDRLYLNYYGKTGTIATVPFYQALAGKNLNSGAFGNKIVMVGYSEKMEPEKSPGIYSVFSDENISPIEIAATAVGNLIERSWLRPLSANAQLLIIFGWGFAMAIIGGLAGTRLASGAIVLCSLVYLGTAYWQFCVYDRWLPVILPVFLQTPLIVASVVLAHFKKSRQETLNLHKAFSFYLPNEVVDQITSGPSRQETIGKFGELMQGVCLATDAGRYTTLSESLNPIQLNELMNDYYNVLFPEVNTHHGIISDVIGDAMLALWAKPAADISCRVNACRTALAIKAKLALFNQSQPYQLPTRFGLHFGDMRLGNVGAAGRYEYRAVGDMINTAARIENLNKILGTQILASEQVIAGLFEFISREMGTFILRGKTLPITIHELAEQKIPNLHALFAEALALFQAYRWPEALTLFRRIAEQYPEDGPTLFYIRYLQKHVYLFKKAPAATPEQKPVIEIGNITTLLHS